MPCFKGLAVSIHTPEGPLSEYSIQKQTRASRIACYIPVPIPKTPYGSSHPEQSTFAISIMLLVPGCAVPYSRPQPTLEDPYPSQKIVGGLPGLSGERGKYSPAIGPYVPLTSSPYETIAAYIHFDGRTKEEVATLLRRGEETWVNSRWVSIPESEGGGLAEREFLFREVGLERWLNGLDLEGESKDVAARIERRRLHLEKKRQKKLDMKLSEDDEDREKGKARTVERNGVLRYADDKMAPLEPLSGDDGMLSSDSESEDDVPMPEAAGQIKVSLYRVLASGEIKRGEYSPQFDAHDDDDGMHGGNGPSGQADVDHTTTFAKPKTLDPSSISTQTVTGIDPPDKPYATFTFFYRGEKQLQKMGILPAPAPAETTPIPTKRRSRQLDFASLPPLKPKDGTAGFTGYRDPTAAPSHQFDATEKGTKKKNADEMDSDSEDDKQVSVKLNGADNDEMGEKDDGNVLLTAEETAKRAELAEGVKKMQLKRQHSFDLSASSILPSKQTTPSQPADMTNQSSSTPAVKPTQQTPPGAPFPSVTPRLSELASDETSGSPFKRQRADEAEGTGLNITGINNVAPPNDVGLVPVKAETTSSQSPLLTQPELTAQGETSKVEEKSKQDHDGDVEL